MANALNLHIPVPVADGGTGNATQTVNGVLYATTATSVISDPSFTYSNGSGTNQLIISSTTNSTTNLLLLNANATGTVYVLINRSGLSGQSLISFTSGVLSTEWNLGVGTGPNTGTNIFSLINASNANVLTATQAGVIQIPNLAVSSPVFTDASHNLTSTGIVPVANGGTGSSTTLNASGVLFANAAATSVITDPSFTYNNTSGTNTLELNGTTNSTTNLLLMNTNTTGLVRVLINRSGLSAQSLIEFSSGAVSIEWILGVGTGPNTGTNIFSLTNASSANVLTATQAGLVTVSTGSLAIATATQGLQQKSVSAASGTGNGAFNTGVTLVAGTKTISNSYVTTSCVGFASVSATGGTPGTSGYRVVCGTGTYTVTGIATDTSTLNVAFILGN
jgi:hypothetical protein